MNTCTVEGCGKPTRRVSLCEMHYHRQYRTGTTEQLRPWSKAAGETCAVTSCTAPALQAYGPVDARVLYCGMHVARVDRHGHPGLDLDYQHPAGEAHPQWRGDAVGYGAAHERVTRARGQARAYTCCDCAEQPAAHWSYDHSDPTERQATEGPYSVDVARYQPRCASCHKRYDLAQLSRTEATR